MLTSLLAYNYILSIGNTNTIHYEAYGPGLRSEFDVPVRYFYIRTLSSNGEFNSSLNVKFTIKFHQGADLANSRIAFRYLVYDLKNGTHLVTVRFFRSYQFLYLQIFANDEEIEQSPIFLNKPITDSECNCPQSYARWRLNLQCPTVPLNNTNLMKYYTSINITHLYERATAKFQHSALVHYVIKNNKIYRRTFGLYTDFKMFSDEALIYLTKKYQMSNTEFFMNLGDWPQEFDLTNPIPIISWCGSNQTADIIIPTYDIMRAVLHGMYRQELDILSTFGNVGPNWEEKIPKAFFRGRDSRKERLDLVEKRRNATDKYDVGITHFFFFKHDIEKYGPITDRLSMYDFTKYKYQLSLDGTVAAYRMPYLLSGSSLIFKQNSDYYEHFYSSIKPWIHYIPFSENLDVDELDRLIDWAESHENKVRLIVEKARSASENLLFPDKILCYLAQVLEEYAKKLVGTIQVYPDMELVEQTKDACPVCAKNEEHDEL